MWVIESYAGWVRCLGHDRGSANAPGRPMLTSAMVGDCTPHDRRSAPKIQENHRRRRAARSRRSETGWLVRKITPEAG
jgi:hypothetical protein